MAQPGPIPIKFDDKTRASIVKVSERTGAAQADIIRRCVEFSLGLVQTTGRIDFLFDKELADQVLREAMKGQVERNKKALEDHSESPPLRLVSEQPVAYEPARRTRKKHGT